MYECGPRPKGCYTLRMHKIRLVVLWGLAALAGGGFFWCAPRIWPLADMDLRVNENVIQTEGRAALRRAGFSLAPDWDFSATVQRNESAMDFVVRNFGKGAVDSMARAGVPLLWHRVLYKKPGEASLYGVQWRPGFGALGWFRRTEADEPGSSVTLDSARVLAQAGLLHTLPRVWNLPGWTLTENGSRKQEQRLDHWFLFEREISPGFRQQLRATVAGARLIQAEASLALPAAALRQERKQDAGRDLLFYGAILAMVFFGVLALKRTAQSLADGSARPYLAARAVLVVGLCLVGTYALDGGRLFAEWDPLWPRWISYVKTVVLRLAYDLPMLLLLFALVTAGDVVERAAGWERGRGLWDFLNGRWRTPGLGWAILRGYALAFGAGAFLVGMNLLFVHAGGHVQAQPQGFFTYALNSSMPGISTLVFFLNIALLEELGYRLFAQSYLSTVLRRPWARPVAVLLPSLIFGAIHAPMYFLPPLDPWWGRVAIMFGIGIIWSLAAWRWGLLTVVVAHWASDLFIFNWPRIAAGGYDTWAAALVVAVPGLCGLAALGLGRRMK
jgi:membrane protease YdiL (CAAX protease family)